MRIVKRLFAGTARLPQKAAPSQCMRLVLLTERAKVLTKMSKRLPAGIGAPPKKAMLAPCTVYLQHMTKAVAQNGIENHPPSGCCELCEKEAKLR